MIVATDTSSLVAYLSDSSGKDVEQIDSFLDSGSIMLPPVVVAEMLSDPNLPESLIKFIRKIPLLEILPGYWERAGMLRSKIISKSFKARLGDALISQSCIDHNIPLITRDKDFRHFSKHGNLTILN